MQPGQPRSRAWPEANARGVDVVGNVFHKRSILIQEHRTMVHISGPRGLTHGKNENFGNDRLFRLGKDEPNRLGDIGGVLKNGRVEVGKAVEQKRRSHAAGDDGRDLDIVRPSLDV